MAVVDPFLATLRMVGAPQEQARRVLFVLLPQVNLLDLAGPVQVFHASGQLGVPYELHFCASQPEVASAPGLVLAHLEPLIDVAPDDLVIVPGLQLECDPLHDLSLDPELNQWLNQAHMVGAHIASVCTGAFVLGEAGLLNGHRCTTHWISVADLQARYPRARVQDSALYIHDGRITTSAGVASGIDMALSLLEHQHGPLFTAQVARYLVIYLRRNGSQPQDSVYLQYRTHLDPGVHRVQDHLISHLTEPVSLPALAQVGQMSTRSLTRAFKEATGLTPVQYHQRLQLELAATLLHNPELSIEEIAHKCGFEDARHFRRLWQRQFGLAPSASRVAHALPSQQLTTKKNRRQEMTA